MRPGDRITFDIEGDVRYDGQVTIGCERFTMDQINGASKKSKVKGTTIKIKGAKGVVGQDGRVQFEGVVRRFLPAHVEGRATNLKIKKNKVADMPDVQVGVSHAALHGALDWQPGDKIVWDEAGNTGPRVRRDDGLWYKETTGRTGRRRGWTDRYYDDQIQQGKVLILRKGGVDLVHA